MWVKVVEAVRIEKDCEFVSTQDGLSIKYDVYMPDRGVGLDSESRSGECVASRPVLIQIAHGMVEHKERYEWVGLRLAQRGFCVVINDHRGHGESIDSCHPLGEMHGIESSQHTRGDRSSGATSGFLRAIEDMHTLTHLAKARFKPQKFVLLGHSMGSLLSRGYLLAYPQELDALILSGSPAYNPLVGLGKTLAQILKFCTLEQMGKNLINALSFGGFNKPFARVQNHLQDSQNASGECAWLCRDKAVVEAYRNDPKCSFVFSLQSFIGLFEGMSWVNTTRAKGADGLPLLIVSGRDDSCGDFGKGVEAIAHKYKAWGLDVELKLYDGARHEILNEYNKAEVLADIVGFIESIESIDSMDGMKISRES